MAKLVETEKEMDLGFQNVSPGVYNWVIVPGVKLWKAEEGDNWDGVSKTVSVNIPVQVQSVARGVNGNKADPDAVGGKATFTAFIRTKEGKLSDWNEQQVLTVMTICGVMKRMAEKFGGEVNMTDQKFIDTLNLALPGKQFQGTHILEKRNDREFVKFMRVEEVKSAGAAEAPKETAPTEADQTSGGHDW